MNEYGGFGLADGYTLEGTMAPHDERSVRAAKIHPELACRVLGESDAPWSWKYGWSGLNARPRAVPGEAGSPTEVRQLPK